MVLQSDLDGSYIRFNLVRMVEVVVLGSGQVVVEGRVHNVDEGLNSRSEVRIGVSRSETSVLL